jgi:uncharacterized protein (DUF486 family)
MPALSIFMPLVPIILLSLSNVFMMFAWYGHLKFPNHALWAVILVSWAIAFLEYCLAVPANRIGYQFFSAPELRTMQVVISLIVFSGFSMFYLDEKFTIMHIIGFAFIGVGATLVFFGAKSSL